jgi:NAD+ diphosphatase
MSDPMVFTASPLDRAAHLRRDGTWLKARLADGASRFLALSELKALIRPGARPEIAWQPAAAVAGALADGALCVMLGLREGVCHFALDATAHPCPPEAGKFIDVRTIAPQLAAGEAAILAQARSLIDWHARHGFCAVCGGPTAIREGGYSRACVNEQCAAQHFPRTDPVAIMLVLHGERCLLGRQPRFPPGMYSALAGFIEPGETIEDAVRREVAEEAGVRVGAVRYLASQPWPFPSSLMIGCVGEALSEEIRVDGAELDDARWFPRADIAAMVARSLDMDASPRLPPPLSLAHQLARIWLGMR